MWSPKIICAGCLNAPLPWCAAGAEWTLTLVDPPADLNLYVTADARVLIFRERARTTSTPVICAVRGVVAGLRDDVAAPKQRTVTTTGPIFAASPTSINETERRLRSREHNRVDWRSTLRYARVTQYYSPAHASKPDRYCIWYCTLRSTAVKC
jgi:hypothetical protein